MTRSRARRSMSIPSARRRPIGSAGSSREASTTCEPGGTAPMTASSAASASGERSRWTSSTTSTNGRSRASSEAASSPSVVAGTRSSSASAIAVTSRLGSSSASSAVSQPTVRGSADPVREQRGLAVAGGRDEQRSGTWRSEPGGARGAPGAASACGGADGGAGARSVCRLLGEQQRWTRQSSDGEHPPAGHGRQGCAPPSHRPWARTPPFRTRPPKRSSDPGEGRAPPWADRPCACSTRACCARPDRRERCSAPTSRRARHRAARARRRGCWRRSSPRRSPAPRRPTWSSELVLLAAAFAARGALAWGVEVAGRRAASTALSELRLALAARRLRAQPAALDGVQAGEVTAAAVQGVEALGTYFARCLPQVVLAVRRAGDGARRGRRRRPLSAVIMARDAAARAGVHVAGRPLHRAAHDRALARAAAAVRALPRRRPRPADAARLQPRAGRGGHARGGRRELPAGDDGHAARRVPVGGGARACRDARRGGRRGRRRPAAGRRRARRSRPA